MLEEGFTSASIASGPIEWMVIHLPTRREVMRVWAVNDHAAKRAAGCYNWSTHTVLEV